MKSTQVCLFYCKVAGNLLLLLFVLLITLWEREMHPPLELSSVYARRIIRSSMFAALWTRITTGQFKNWVDSTEEGNDYVCTYSRPVLLPISSSCFRVIICWLRRNRRAVGVINRKRSSCYKNCMVFYFLVVWYCHCCFFFHEISYEPVSHPTSF